MFRSRRSNRLAKLFRNFASECEFPHNVDPGGKSATVGIPESSRLIETHYTFDNSQDSYTFGAPLGDVSDRKQSRFLKDLMKSAPMVGITERLIGNKFVILDGRDCLNDRTDAEIREGFMDDAARIATYFRESGFRG